MLVTTLSGGTAIPVLVGASQSGRTARQVEEGEADAGRILGTWQVVKMSMAGKETRDPELSGATLTFRAADLTLASRSGKKIRFQITFEKAATPPAFYAHEEETDQREHGWMIYRFVGETLEIAFFDGLGEKPAGFEPENRLVLIALKRELPPKN